MDEYCLITHMGDNGTYQWFSDLCDARSQDWPEGACSQTILEYRGGRAKPVSTPYRNEWFRAESWSKWIQVMDEQGPIPRQEEILVARFRAT